MKKLLYLLVIFMFLPLNINAVIVVIDGLRYNIYNSKAYVIKDTGYSGNITIPGSITYNNKVYKVIIGSNAFDGCESLLSVSIQEGVEEIGDEAFKGCSFMEAITLPESILKIGLWAFQDCTSLSSVSIPHDINQIETGAFAGCSSLATVDYPEKMTTIGRSLFKDCKSLSSFIISSNVTSIGEYNQEIKGETNVEIISVIA